MFEQPSLEHSSVSFVEDFQHIAKPVKTQTSPKRPLVSSTRERLNFTLEVKDAVYLMRFTNHQDHNRWKVVDDAGQDIKILQCMHQINMSKDYIILIDAAFKLSVDVLMNAPFPDNQKITDFFRQQTTATQSHETPVYIVKRSDLKAERKTVTAKRVNLNPEFIHFAVDYANNKDCITLYTASNSAACLAEWVRSYDKLFPNTPIESGTEGILCSGSMDVGRVGKIVIDAEQACIKEEILTHKTGNVDKPGKIGPHTWLSGFYTFRDIISAERPVEEIKNIYWQFGGLERKRLTQFVYDLYKDYPNRIVPAEKVKQYSEQGIPLQIARVNTDQMEIEDYYEYPLEYSLGAIQFVPRKTPNKNMDPSMDGYLFTTMINGVEEEGDDLNYLREIWIFDASNLAQGPVCTLTHPEFNFGFTLHSLWIADTEKATMQTSFADEYQELINKVDKQHRKYVREIFDKEVFPRFAQKPTKG